MHGWLIFTRRMWPLLFDAHIEYAFCFEGAGPSDCAAVATPTRASPPTATTATRPIIDLMTMSSFP